jgi:ATP-dependent DNA helicase DinG
VVIDEAHTIESAATSFFSEEMSRLGIFRQLGRLYRRRRARQFGLLVRLASVNNMEDKLNDAVEGIEKLRDKAGALDEAALGLCLEEGAFRLTPARAGTVKAVLAPRLVDLRKRISALVLILRDMLDEAGADKDAEPLEAGDKAAAWEIKSVVRRLESYASLCASFIEFEEHPELVCWIERHAARGEKAGLPGGTGWASFTATPLDVAPSLKDALFAPNKTVICTSATLTVNNDFSYWMGRNGLSLVDPDERPVLSGRFASPFPYSSQVLVSVPRDAPLPTAPEYRPFVDKAVLGLMESAGGSALALFTSYEALKSAYAFAAPELEKQGIRCLKQGDDDRSRILKTFLDDQASVLFATASFWEGVDAPGDTLRLVILCRLPFRTPNEPVFQARCEALEREGLSSFMTLSLPEAVMKFKQGFGRLMRRSSDRGVVAVLDGRIIQKRYGQAFLRSIPKTRTSFADYNTILRNVEDFLFNPV